VSAPAPLYEIAISPFYDLEVAGGTIWCADTATTSICGFALATGKEVARFAVERGMGMRASAKLVGAGRNRLEIHDRKGKQLRTLEFDKQDSFSTTLDAFDRAGTLAVGTHQETFVLWNPNTGAVVHSSANGYWADTDIAPDGSRISITRRKEPLVLVDPKTFARRSVKDASIGGATSWSPDGKLLVLTASLSTVVVDAVKGVVIQKLKTPRSQQGIFIPGRDRFVMGERKLTVFDTKTWKIAGVIEGVAMRAIAVSEDGERIVTTPGDAGPIQVWATDDLLAGIAQPKVKKAAPKAAKGQPIKGVFFGVPATVPRAALVKAAEGLHYILDRRPPEFAMELALAPKGRDRHWFRFLGSRGRNYLLEPWIECLQSDLEVPLDVVLRTLETVSARRFTNMGNSTDITVPDDYLDAARVPDPILVKKNGGTYGKPVTRAEIKHLINTVELYYPPSFIGAKSTKVGKVR
jgi:hypothetical protein